MTFDELQPGDFQATSIEGGLPKMVRIWEHLRELNVGGYGGAVLVDVKDAISKGKNGVTSCSPFTATCIYMAIDPRPFDPGQPWSLKEPYQPVFDGGKPLDVNFYRLHNGFSLSTYASVKDKKFVAWKADFKKRYVDRIPQLASDLRAFEFINHSSGSLIALNLGTRIEPKKVRRGDQVGIDWHNGNGHATFCWNVHLDKNGDVDCFQFISSNGTAAGGGAGITIFRYPDVDPAYMEKSGGKYKKKKEMFSGIIDDPQAYPEYIQEPYWWFGLPGVKKGDIDLNTFGVPAKSVQISYADSMDVSVHTVHVARLNGVTPPEPYLRADGGRTPEPKSKPKPQALTTVKSKKVDQAAARATAPPEKARPGPPHPVQDKLEGHLQTLFKARWISKDPGNPDSVNDPESQAAIRDYQEKFMKGDVPKLGHADPKTRDRIAKAAAAAANMPTVKAGLALAHDRGDIKSAPSADHWQLDDATRAAVKDFQRFKHIGDDGIPGHGTQEKLSAYMKEAARSKPAAVSAKTADLPPGIVLFWFWRNHGPAGGRVKLHAVATPASNGKTYSIALYQGPNGEKELLKNAGEMKVAGQKGSAEVQVPDDVAPGTVLIWKISGDGVSKDSPQYTVDRDRWFVDMRSLVGEKSFNLDHPLWMPDSRRGNDVKFLLTGWETFNAMARAMKTAVQNGHFIYLANWDAYDDFNLERSGENDPLGRAHTTLREILQAASLRGVMVRGLFWWAHAVDRLGMSNNSENTKTRDFIKQFGGHAIGDGRCQDMGSHHQKLLLVNGSEGLIAFAGGRDFSPNRVVAGSQPKSAFNPFELLEDASAPQLDMHVQIQGPAAYDLLEIFLRRYADHPSAKDTGIIALRPDRRPRPGTSRPVAVRVCSTSGNAPDPDGPFTFAPSQDVKDRLVPSAKEADTVKISVGPPATAIPSLRPYSYAKNGRQSGRAQLLHAISAARKFIYFEDQYMVSEEIAEALKKAVKRGVALLGVIPHQTISTDFDPKPDYTRAANVLARTRRDRVINVIYGDDAKPLDLTFLFCPYRPDERGPLRGPYQYVHSKLFIFDDDFCTIGSMNFNRRSTTHDSELSLGFYDPGPVEEDGFVKRLRIGLWKRHLGLGDGDVVQLDDPLSAIQKLWSKVSLAPPLVWGKIGGGVMTEIGGPLIDALPDKPPSRDSIHEYWSTVHTWVRPIKLPDGRQVTPNVLRYDWSEDEPLGLLSSYVNQIPDAGVSRADLPW